MTISTQKMLTTIYVFLIFSFIVCKKIPAADLNNIKSAKLNECQRCEVLSNSFMHWLDKTSRGKFEGGDAAWEEAKLKSYSRSEIRLVEVQEGLCSELTKHKDICYSLAEESEAAIEQWWFHEDPQSSDLYTWLCIETLQYCCPENHFGISCTQCLFDKNNMVCNGQGSCDGEGTRRGNGTCICHQGYSGPLCEICASNYYNVDLECKPCHKACNECVGEGANACKQCGSGWQLELGVCVDVNECLLSSSCKDNQYCVNREGFHSCKMCDDSCMSCVGAGESDCTLCKLNSVLWNGRCVDEELKSNIIRNSLKRFSLYSGLLIIAFFIYRNSKMLASLIVLIIAMYVYYSEKLFEINILDVFLNLYLTQ